MAVGIRIRGGANQLQVSDESPVYMILSSGTLVSSQKITGTPPAGGEYWMWQRVYFPAVIKSDEPPLIFFNVTNTIIISKFVILGAPGNWTGFMFEAGIGINMDLPVLGDWIAATTEVPKSSDKVGIRIRKKDTGGVIFDTGYRLLKFQTYLSSFRRATEAETARWQNRSGGLSIDLVLWMATRPAGCYMMMNGITGDTSEVAPQSWRAPIVYGLESAYPTLISVGIRLANLDNFSAAMLAAYYYGTFIFAKPGT